MIPPTARPSASIDMGKETSPKIKEVIRFKKDTILIKK
jgi:hypothetical protein